MEANQIRQLALHCDTVQIAEHTSPAAIRLLEQAISGATQNQKSEETSRRIKDEEMVDNLISEAQKLIQLGFTNEAELLLIAIASETPTPDLATIRLAELYEKQSAYEKTVSFTKGLIKKGGSIPEAIYQLSFALYKLGRSDEALEHLLPLFSLNPSPRISRLFGLCLKSIGMTHDAIDVLADTIEENPNDVHSIRALSEIYVDAGAYQKSLDIIHMVPADSVEDTDRIYEALVYRFMGQTKDSIDLMQKVIEATDGSIDALWPQCFTYSISGIEYSRDLTSACSRYWSISGFEDLAYEIKPVSESQERDARLRIGFMTSDIGEHVVSRFLAPVLRNCNRDKYFICLLSTARRFEDKAVEIINEADSFHSLQELSMQQSRELIRELGLDIIIDTNGFTRNSGLPILGQRCAPVQCHYIGYHATTGLRTIDYFLGDSVTTPPALQDQYTEKLIQIPNLWMAYDSKIEFPEAVSKTSRDSPVLGAFSQVTKMNRTTLEFWAAAMNRVPHAVLAIKDRGVQCPTTCKRIEDTFEEFGIDPNRVYLFGPVGLQSDHLDAYNAIDIALDTTPWSGATTAFEALGMGVPLVTICGDTTSARMSSSVVSAAGMKHWIARTKEEFADIVATLADDYISIRNDKRAMQQRIRSGILFDEHRISRDFYATIDQLVSSHKQAGGLQVKRT